jgi:two-component system chemotaxis response regulator CheY
MNKDIKILIADDSAFMRTILKDMLVEGGFSKFIECSNGKECLELLEKESPDLLLLDIIMPDVTGLDVLKQMQKKVKTLVISAVGQDDMIKEAESNGASGYIVKPFENKQVLSEIEKIMK